MLRLGVAAVLAFSIVGCARGEAGPALKRALDQTYVPRPTNAQEVASGRSAAAAKAFAQALDQATSGLSDSEQAKTEGSESVSIESKLMAIAVYRREHPDLFEEIGSAYVREESAQGQARTPPHPADRHLTEAYRLVWEYFLLSPAPGASAPGYWTRSLEAVEEIGSPRSCVTLSHALRVRTTADGEPSDRFQRSKPILAALVRIAAPESLDAMAQAFPASSDAGTRRLRGDAVVWVAQVIGRLREPDKRAAWRSIVDAAQSTPDAADRRAWASDLAGRLRGD